VYAEHARASNVRKLDDPARMSLKRDHDIFALNLVSGGEIIAYSERRSALEYTRPTVLVLRSTPSTVQHADGSAGN
jgi:hypothetical protein